MSPKWKTLAGIVPGTAHDQRGVGCQDYGHVVDVGPSLVAVCSDGAGSALHAATGAMIACLTMLHTAAEELRANPFALSEETLRGGFDRARRAVSLEACINNRAIRDYACTLLAVVVTPQQTLFAQVGDGAMVYKSDQGYEVAIWPQVGEYANMTNFLTDSGYEQRLELRSIAEQVSEVAVLTDGLQALALDYATRRVHGPFFLPLFDSLRVCDDPARLVVPMNDFLRGSDVNKRTDDDKTLILAAR